MFTGIIEERGQVLTRTAQSGGERLTVGCSAVLSGISIGASIAVNGVCLTAVAVGPDSFAADLAPETLRRSNLGGLNPGSPVNLERPVTPATLLSGHIVQGHIDVTGELISIEPVGAPTETPAPGEEQNWWIQVRVPHTLSKYLVEKGSITLDGISLTIATLETGADGDALVGVTIIPHTFAHTTLGSSKPGARINIEADVLAKHVERLLAHRLAPPTSDPT